MTKLPSHEAKHAELRIQFPRSTPPPPNSSTSAVRNRRAQDLLTRRCQRRKSSSTIEGHRIGTLGNIQTASPSLFIKHFTYHLFFSIIAAFLLHKSFYFKSCDTRNPGFRQPMGWQVHAAPARMGFGCERRVGSGAADWPPANRKPCHFPFREFVTRQLASGGVIPEA